MSHENHNGNRHVETIADPTDPILADAAPIAHKPGPHDSTGPHNPKEVNPKMSSDIAYWSHEFGITGQKLHDLIRVHGTHIDKLRAALHSHKTA